MTTANVAIEGYKNKMTYKDKEGDNVILEASCSTQELDEMARRSGYTHLNGNPIPSRQISFLPAQEKWK